MSSPSPSRLLDLITSSDDRLRNLSASPALRRADPRSGCWISARSSMRSVAGADNLYERVRALFFLSSIHRYELPPVLAARDSSLIPFEGFTHLLRRRFNEAIDVFLAEQRTHGASDAISSALAQAYHGLAFQTLADQVRRSVRTVRGNQWMFRIGHPADQPLRIRQELLKHDRPTGRYPDPARTHAGAHGSLAQRLERHLLPRHGLSPRARR